MLYVITMHGNAEEIAGGGTWFCLLFFFQNAILYEDKERLGQFSKRLLSLGDFSKWVWKTSVSCFSEGRRRELISQGLFSLKQVVSFLSFYDHWLKSIIWVKCGFPGDVDILMCCNSTAIQCSLSLLPRNWLHRFPRSLRLIFPRVFSVSILANGPHPRGHTTVSINRATHFGRA